MSIKIPKMNLTPCMNTTLLFLSARQGSSTKDYFLQRTMQSLERYFYLIVFNAYLHQQVNASRRCSSSPLGSLRFLPRTVSLRCPVPRCVLAVSAGLRHRLQPVDVLPRLDLPPTGPHEPVGAVGAGRAGHQRSPRPGEEPVQLRGL